MTGNCAEDGTKRPDAQEFVGRDCDSLMRGVFSFQDQVASDLTTR